ncbi:sarcoplasmic calcium-binding protein-like [Ostrea edulis]|uniref:sarcoplasmic calcium-binding protein-like n=1 Tax=Ostrea edulis TaxID=37623 RepID=UPI0024AE9563|nr:sarcoplasmic calcium-binding protein-like [Ostrea edulis]XP_056008029.1 sarcoplasmic calcium-binding protein-like [Ostrea edulis]
MEYLVAKWKHWYSYLDVNKDGTISFDDVEECRKKFTKLHALAGEKAKSVEVDIEKWWKTYIFRSSATDEMSENDFISILSADYKKDKQAFKANIQKCFMEVFDVIDVDKDRTIDLGEFQYAFKAFGHENDDILKTVFESYKSADGKVPIKQVVDTWVQFVTDEDSSKKDILKEAFTKGM